MTPERGGRLDPAHNASCCNCSGLPASRHLNKYACRSQSRASFSHALCNRHCNPGPFPSVKKGTPCSSELRNMDIFFSPSCAGILKGKNGWGNNNVTSSVLCKRIDLFFPSQLLRFIKAWKGKTYLNHYLAIGTLNTIYTIIKLLSKLHSICKPSVLSCEGHELEVGGNWIPLTAMRGARECHMPVHTNKPVILWEAIKDLDTKQVPSFQSWRSQGKG